MRQITFAFIAVFLLVAAAPAVAAEKVLGYWKTIDDKTKTKKSIVHIFKKGDKYYGKIIALFRKPNEEQDPKCDKCPGAKKNKKTIGMEILWKLKRKKWKKGRFTYKDGKILDPNNGKVYTCQIWPNADGSKLNVRGYILFFYRTQVWLRASKAEVAKARARVAKIRGKKAPARRGPAKKEATKKKPAKKKPAER